MRFERKGFISGFLFISLAMITCFILQICELDALYGLKILGWICLLEIALFFIFHRYSTGYNFEFSVVFVFVLYIFNFGQLMIYTFFRGVYSHVRFLLLMSEENAYYGFLVMNYAFIAICGAILIGEAKVSVSSESIKHETTNEYEIRKIIKTLIAITFPVKVILDIVTLYISLSVSGPAAREWVNSFPNVFLYFGKISLMGFALLIILERNNYIKQRRAFIFISGYILLMMMSGIRSENAGYLLVFAFIFFFTCEKKINVLSALLIVLFGVIALAFISATGDFRYVSDKSMSTFINLFSKNLFENNILLYLLDTLGDTGYTGQCVINSWLPNNGLYLGKSYLMGLFSVVPNIPYVFTLPGKIVEESYFALTLQRAGSLLSEKYKNIGGSMLGEAFFNFGIVGGVVAAYIIGLVFGVLSKKFTKSLENSDFRLLIWLVPFMFFGIYWVRDYFGGGFREVVWGPVVFLVIRNLYRRRQR